MKAVVQTADVMRAELASALLVYEDRDSAYVTVHQVRQSNGKADIGPGVPASRSALSTLAAKLHNAAALSGFIPERLVYMSPRTLAWWRPAAPARMFFAEPEDTPKTAKRIGTRNGIALQPSLVFAVTARDWYVWALAGDTRPTDETQLCRAPHFNVYEAGTICTGNVKLPDTLSPAVLDEYESAFFGSNFTHPNEPRGITRHKGGIYALWLELLAGKHATFPVKSLAPMKQTLGAAIKQLETSP